jgi:hypothetical protein
MHIIPEEPPSQWEGKHRLSIPADTPPARVLDSALQAIGKRYGTSTANFVAMQLEYPK